MASDNLMKEIDLLMEKIALNSEKGNYSIRLVNSTVGRISKKYHIPKTQVLLELISRADDPFLKERLNERLKKQLELDERGSKSSSITRGQEYELRVVEEKTPPSIKKVFRKDIRITSSRRGVSDEELKATHEALTRRLGRFPTAQEIVSALGKNIKPDDIAKRLDALNIDFDRSGLIASNEEFESRVINEIQEVYTSLEKRLGRPPSKDEFLKAIKSEHLPFGLTRLRRPPFSDLVSSLRFYDDIEKAYHDVGGDPYKLLKSVKRNWLKGKYDHPLVKSSFEQVVRDLARKTGGVPTAKDISKALGYSLTTVSKMLEEYGLKEDIPTGPKAFKQARQEEQRIRQIMGKGIGRKKR